MGYQVLLQVVLPRERLVAQVAAVVALTCESTCMLVHVLHVWESFATVLAFGKLGSVALWDVVLVAASQT